MCEDITKLEHCLFFVTGNRPSKPRGGFCYGHVLPKMLCPAHAQLHIRGIYEPLRTGLLQLHMGDNEGIFSETGIIYTINITSFSYVAYKDLLRNHL